MRLALIVFALLVAESATSKPAAAETESKPMEALERQRSATSSTAPAVPQVARVTASALLPNDMLKTRLGDFAMTSVERSAVGPSAVYRNTSMEQLEFIVERDSDGKASDVRCTSDDYYDSTSVTVGDHAACVWNDRAKPLT